MHRQYRCLRPIIKSMGAIMKKLLPILAILIVMVLDVSGCTPKTGTTTTTITSTISTTAGQPVEVVSVLSTYKSGQTVNPGGPEIEITLKNVSDEPVVYLTATLELLSVPANSGMKRSWDYVFSVSPSNPLPPGKSISSKNILIGGGFDENYAVSINGTMQSGIKFSYTK
jgi:hypothetical protein